MRLGNVMGPSYAGLNVCGLDSIQKNGNPGIVTVKDSDYSFAGIRFCFLYLELSIKESLETGCTQELKQKKEVRFPDFYSTSIDFQSIRASQQGKVQQSSSSLSQIPFHVNTIWLCLHP